jgi:hypothetical protein
MNSSRGRLIKLIGSLTVGTTIGIGSSVAGIQIPLERPVAEPISEELLAMEETFKDALKAQSEDRCMTTTELSILAGNKSSDLVNTAILDLLWLQSIEEVDEGSFCLVKSGIH